jgi:hypothetical protein
VTIRGRFAAATHKTWDAFESNGEKVNAGSTLTVHLVDQAGKLYNVRADAQKSIVDSLSFGVEVEVEAEARPVRNDFRFYALQLRAAPGAKG